MGSVVNPSRAVALTYALMATWCFVSSALLVAIDGPRFWSTLWYYLHHDPYYLRWTLCAGLTLCALAVLSFRYRALGGAWRNMTLGVSAFIALWRFGDAVWLTLLKMLATTAIPSADILVGRWLLASVLAVCAYTLWRCGRASNNRWRGP